MKERDRTEKVNLLQACKTFNGWSGQPLISVADLIQWTKYPANTGTLATILLKIPNQEKATLNKIVILWYSL